jgi:vacuolar-type H+-ATPase subunit F/Vma7
MVEEKIIVIGDDEIITMLGLIGIDGIILEEPSDFLKVFHQLTNDLTISMIIIAVDLPEKTFDLLIDYKLNKRRPFIFYMPNIFNLRENSKDFFLNKIFGSISKLIL